MTGEAPGPPQSRKGVQGGSGLARHWFHGRFQASALPLVKLWAVLQSAGLPEGPGSLARHWIRSGSRLPFGPHFPHPAQGGNVSPDSAANSGRAGLTPPPHGSSALGRTCSTRGPVEARIPPRTAGGPGRHPPLDGCRPARGPGGLPGRSLSLSLGRESEARGRAATGVLLE